MADDKADAMKGRRSSGAYVSKSDDGPVVGAHAIVRHSGHMEAAHCTAALGI